MGAVVAARVDLQQQLGEWLTRSLASVAAPYRFEAAVRLEMRGFVREVRAKQQTATPSVKIGGKNRVKLPGLGMVDGGGGQTNIMPEINIDGGTRTSETVSRQLETEIVKFTLHLFVDTAMPKERRELLVRLATELAGVDPARGDEVLVEEWAAPAASAPGIPVTLSLSQRLPLEVLAACAAALGAAAILAFGLSRRAGASAQAERGGRAGGDGEVAVAVSGASAASVEAAERARRRESLDAFKVLADATPRELVQVLAEADPHTAAAVADLVGFDAETAKLVETLVPPQRRVEIGIGLATKRVLTREQLAHLEAAAGQVLQRVRSRVSLGGAAKLADFLALAPPSVRAEVLEGVAARDEALARSAREAMLLFEDLPKLSEASLRQVVTAVDPALVALAIVGAPEVRDVVLNAVSKRLRGILEVEEEVAREQPAEDVEKARREIEAAMRQLSERGELRARAA